MSAESGPTMKRITSYEEFMEEYGDFRIPSMMMGVILKRYGVVSEQNFWQWREIMRFIQGDYQHVSHLHKREHMLHRTLDKADMVSYTPSVEYGMQDRQLRVKYGRYLKKEFPDLPDHDIASRANAYRVESEQFILRIADTSEEIVDVYLRGPDSCMAHEESHFECEGHHPVEVYGHKDVGVAYIERNGRVTARTVINKKYKQYVRVYGDEGALLKSLHANGYEEGDLDGCGLLYITTSGGVVMPYLDGIQTVEVNHSSMTVTIDSDGGHAADMTSGVLNACGLGTCSGCGDDVPETELENVIDSDGDRGYALACASCQNNDYVYALTRYGNSELCHSEDVEYTQDTDEAVHAAYARECEDYVRIDGLLYHVENTFTCAASGTTQLTSDGVVPFFDGECITIASYERIREAECGVASLGVLLREGFDVSDEVKDLPNSTDSIRDLLRTAAAHDRNQSAMLVAMSTETAEALEEYGVEVCTSMEDFALGYIEALDIPLYRVSDSLTRVDLDEVVMAIGGSLLGEAGRCIGVAARIAVEVQNCTRVAEILRSRETVTVVAVEQDQTESSVA